MAYLKAIRKAVPLMVDVSGVSGCGKTTTGLLLAAGIANGKRVGFLDTENGRGSLMADEPIIKAALPNGYEYDELIAPFSPDRYIAKIREAEDSGIAVLVVDSTSHEFEGVGGISEVAETHKKKWAEAKRLHKRFLYHCLSSSMDMVFCFRGRDKVKIVKGSNEVIDLGVQPICEKNWEFDMTVRWHIQNITHKAHLLKAPRQIEDKLMEPRMLTVADGKLLLDWKEGGMALDPAAQLIKRARAVAEDGLEMYQQFCDSLSAPQKRLLGKTAYEEFRLVAIFVDEQRAAEDGPAGDVGDASEPIRAVA